MDPNRCHNPPSRSATLRRYTIRSTQLTPSPLMLTVPDNYIGTLSSSMFAGMMVGAIGWGTCSDLMGRSAAFNATLFFTALFGILASFASSFVGLCVILFLLGSAVGVSLPSLASVRPCNLSRLGFHADRRYASSRAHAKRETAYGHRSLCLLLLRIRRFSTRCSLHPSWPLMFTESTL